MKQTLGKLNIKSSIHHIEGLWKALSCGQRHKIWKWSVEGSRLIYADSNFNPQHLTISLKKLAWFLKNLATSILTHSVIWFLFYPSISQHPFLSAPTRFIKPFSCSFFIFYNSARFHQSLDYSVPDEMYESFQYNGLEYKQAV